MTTRKRIVIYGNSVVVGSVGASLARARQYDVIHLPLPVPSASELAALAPDVVVFDVDSGHAEAAFSLLETCPGLLVLGISPDGDVVRLWSRRQYRARSSRDLAALIAAATDAAAPLERLTGTTVSDKDV